MINPSVLAEAETTLRVTGMDCSDEVAALRASLERVRGVRSVDVNLMKGTATIHHDQTIVVQSLREAVQKAGLRIADESSGGEEEEHHAKGGQRSRLISVLVSGAATAAGLAFQFLKFAEQGRIVLFAIAVVSGGWFIVPKALRALRRLRLDMNVLMTVAVAGAIGIGEWSEAAAVTFLFALAELLEAFSLNRARRAVASLLELAPDTALVVQGEELKETRVELVAVDEVVAVKSGMKVPLDGVVMTGESTINQAPITGESMPVEKKPGDGVFAGTINGEGSLRIKVTKAHSDTTLSRIIKLIGEAQEQKAPTQQFVDRFARIYTPAVFVLAIAVLLIPTLLFGQAWEAWVYRSLVLLVIACPCALVISTPVSIVSGLTAMARRGVLIKGGMFLEEIGRLKALAVDKTGTITEGKPRVQKILALGTATQDEVIAIAAAIDVHSEHPLAQAIVRHATDQSIRHRTSERYQAKTGRGAEAYIDGVQHFVGNLRFTEELGLGGSDVESQIRALQDEALSVVIVGRLGAEPRVLGVIGVGDAVRPGAADAIRSLHRAGVEKIVMLSGDNQKTVNAISKKVGIDEAIGDLLPEAKIDHVRNLLARHKHVGMIGDGVNDAPAMAIASIGIAMGGVGTDTAIETADIALMQDDLSMVAEAVHLGRKTLGIIRANIAFALGIKALFLVLALLGVTSLWLAILADTGATLVVIANALRLLRS